ncbi:hypothetical protein [Paraliomyxa miuraensis]|uniref:hypothetical protein n=1 Tax=Paraliomyxa miuraensis TaxID=376150 RepID=UPI002250920D|nr:hypothetical protein [Paraliomyxa miuraensis]MCX4240350.1 hypothetical protein [Paraliomyxa miuraensis]
MHAHCERCQADVEATHRNPKARKLVRLYPLLIVPFIPALPIIASDFAVMLPLLMIYMLGAGPVIGILREPPLCNECGAMTRPLRPARS